MKACHRIFAAVILLFFALQFFTVSANATYMEHEGLEVTVQMDKDKYEEGELITASITVKNTNNETVTITNLEQLIPEGYRLAEDSEVATKDVLLNPEETVTLKVTYGEPIEFTDEETIGNFIDAIIFGETWGIPNILIVFIAVVMVIIFFKFT